MNLTWGLLSQTYIQLHLLHLSLSLPPPHVRTHTHMHTRARTHIHLIEFVLFVDYKGIATSEE